MSLKALLAASLTLLVASCAPTIKSAGLPEGQPRAEPRAIVTFDGAFLPLRTWLPKDGEPHAVVVALHGMNDYSNAFDGPGTYLAGRGIAVYAYDQRGFGEAPNRGYWAGAETMAEDATVAVAAVHAKYPGKPIYLLGESMGGAVAMLAMTGPRPPAIDGLILSAPAVWSRDAMNVFERSALWLSVHTVPWLTLTGRGLDIMPSDNLPMLRALGRDPLVIKETRVDTIHGICDLMDAAQAAAPRIKVPVLVLYGEHDEIVPADPTYRMMTKLPDGLAPQVKAVYANGWHMLLRDLEADLVLDDIASWIDHPRQPLPSGADARAREVLTTKGNAMMAAEGR